MQDYGDASAAPQSALPSERHQPEPGLRDYVLLVDRQAVGVIETQLHRSTTCLADLDSVRPAPRKNPL